ncbi:hypothetical protein OUZ56_027993 [Daphnia magna]|uniref:Uncharacterized protein n=1 Tax=Daphnia magna TaxID=35525 RepID=A0ABR0B2K1_9CRUS|nr:hypothetical protein OUZ56_027993 [Daphnia magna]
MKEDEDLQKLIKDIPLKKSLAIKKQKQVQAHLNSLMELLKQVEVGLKDQLMKNDLHLAGIMSLDEKLAFAQENKDMTVAAVRETVNFQCDESLAEVANIAEYYELQKRNHFESSKFRKSSHPNIFFIRRWFLQQLVNSGKLVYHRSKSYACIASGLHNLEAMEDCFETVSLSSIENRHSPPQLPTVTVTSSTTTISPSVVEQSLNKPSNSNLAWGPAPTIRQRPFVPSLRCIASGLHNLW